MHRVSSNCIKRKSTLNMNKIQQRELNTEEDFYLAGTAYEDQGERWSQTDIKKSLRCYALAYEMYDKALRNPVKSDNEYDILYNMVRIPLVVYQEYVYDEHGLNTLQYVDLSGIDTSSVVLDLPTIILHFERVYTLYQGWDLEFNLLNCYLTLVENDKHDLGLQEIAAMTQKTQVLVEALLQKISDASPMPDSKHQQDDDDNNNYMDFSESIAPETADEVLVMGFKYVINVKERHRGEQCDALVATLLATLSDAACPAPSEELGNIRKYLWGISLAQDPLALETFVQDESIDLSVRVDTLEYHIDNCVRADTDTETVCWALCSGLSRLLAQLIRTTPPGIAKLGIMLNQAENEARRCALGTRSAALGVPAATRAVLANNHTKILENIVKLAATAGLADTTRHKLQKRSISAQCLAQLSAV